MNQPEQAPDHTALHRHTYHFTAKTAVLGTSGAIEDPPAKAGPSLWTSRLRRAHRIVRETKAFWTVSAVPGLARARLAGGSIGAGTWARTSSPQRRRSRSSQ